MIGNKGDDMGKRKDIMTTIETVNVDETALFERVAAIIENRKSRAESHVNAELTLMYWEIGYYINSLILGGERGKYGKRILATLSPKLSWSHII
jgi:hypothetical protein